MKMSSIQVDVLIRLPNSERMQWQPYTGQSGDHCIAWRVVCEGFPISSEVIDKRWELFPNSWDVLPYTGDKPEREIIFSTAASACEVRDNIRKKIANSG